MDDWGLVEGFHVPKYRSDNEGLAFAQWRKHTNAEPDTRNADVESDKKNHAVSHFSRRAVSRH